MAKQLILSLSLLSLICRGQVSCNGTSDCSIDCTIEDCKPIINASDSINVTIYCTKNDYICSNSQIYCASSSCTVICNTEFSCSNMKVYANHTQNVNITCIDGKYACMEQKIYAQNAESIIYDGINSFTEHLPYEQMEIHAENASDVKVLCKGQSSCANVNIFANYSNSVSLTADHENAWLYSRLYAFSAGYVSITCISQDVDDNGKGACGYGNRYFLPNNGQNTQINCFGLGCRAFGNIYVDESVSNLDISIYGCDKCMDEKDCIYGEDEYSYIKIYCNYTWGEIFLGRYDRVKWNGDVCDDTLHCDCNALNANVKFVDGMVDKCILNGITLQPTGAPTTSSPTKGPTTTTLPQTTMFQESRATILTFVALFVLIPLDLFM